MLQFRPIRADDVFNDIIHINVNSSALVSAGFHHVIGKVIVAYVHHVI